MEQYLKLLAKVRNEGLYRPDRTNTGVYSLFGEQLKFDLKAGFPLVTTKKIHIKSVIHELLWFLSGDTNIGYLKKNGVRIWDQWATEEGDLGPVYGKQWVNWNNKINQIENVVQKLKNKSYSRRLIVSAWNPEYVPDENISPKDNVRLGKMALPPCHMLFQLYYSERGLSCMMTQRSADLFLGVPFNIASYSLLTYMLAQQTGLEVDQFIWSGGDCHIYSNHLAQVDLQLSRKPLPLPKIVLKNRATSIFNYQYEDFQLIDYICHPTIKAPISI